MRFINEYRVFEARRGYTPYLQDALDYIVDILDKYDIYNSYISHQQINIENLSFDKLNMLYDDLRKIKPNIERYIDHQVDIIRDMSNENEPSMDYRIVIKLNHNRKI